MAPSIPPRPRQTQMVGGVGRRPLYRSGHRQTNYRSITVLLFPANLVEALVLTPPVLLLDEPTGPLDSAATDPVETILRQRLDAGLSTVLQLGLAKRFLIAAARMAVQLMLVGMALKRLFAAPPPSGPYWRAGRRRMVVKQWGPHLPLGRLYPLKD